MKIRILPLILLILTLNSCKTTYRDVDLTSGSQILRGTWTGNATYQCDTSITAPTWSSDGSRLAGRIGTQIKIWNGDTAAELANIDATAATTFLLTPDGLELLVQRQKNTTIALERYDPSGTLKTTQVMPEPLYKFSSNLERGATLAGQILRIWNTRDATKILETTIDSAWVKDYSLEFSLNADGSQVAYYDRLNGIAVVDVATNQIIFRQRPEVNTNWSIQSVGFRGDTVILGMYIWTNNTYRIVAKGVWQWSVSTNKLQQFIDTNAVNIQTNGLYSTGYGGEGWDLQTGQQIFKVDRDITSIAPNVTRALTVFRDDTFCGQQFLDPKTNTLLNAKISVTPAEVLAVQIILTPAYQDESTYKVTGTMQISPTRTLELQGLVRANCKPTQPFVNECERFIRPQLSPPPPPIVDILENGKVIGNFRFFFQSNSRITSQMNLENRYYEMPLQLQP